MIVRPSTEMCFKKILNCLTAELQKHFSKKKKKTLSQPTVSVHCSEFKSNIELLKHEVHQTEQLLERKEKSEIAKPSTHVDFVVFQKKKKAPEQPSWSWTLDHIFESVGCRLVCVFYESSFAGC